jgi:endonuclease-3
MPRESQSDKTARTARIIAELRKVYPDAHCELDHATPLQLLIATILSAQCTDKRVNMVTPVLFREYPAASDLAVANQERLEEIIKTTGFFRNKARSIKACCLSLQEKHGGRVPDTMEELTALNGVGRKTANVVLGNAFHKNVGIVVDTHVNRLANRMGLVRGEDPVTIEAALMPLVPRNDWTDFSHLLIWHGRRRCFARNPDCPNCEVRDLCPKVGVAPNKRAAAEIAKSGEKVKA